MPDQDAPIGPVPYGQPGLPPFPTWPPPSGGAPVTQVEQSPKINPVPYGQGQTPNINTAPGNAWPPQKATFYPQAMPKGANGQNQAPPANWPAWPHARVNVLPDKASPAISAISPAPIMGPGSSQPHLAQSQIGRNGPAVKTFPAGSYIDGMGTVVTPTRVIGGLGN